MVSQSPLTVTPSSTIAIDRKVLKVSPEASISDVICQMSCGSQTWRASCAVVVDGSGVVLGIVTERDIVGLAAQQQENTQSLAGVAVSTVMTTPVKTLEESAFQDIFAVLFLFRRYRIRHLPIVNACNQLVGVVTPASIRKVLKPANLLKMRRVSEIMTTGVVQASANVPVICLAQLMAQHRVSCVVIVDTDSAENSIEDGAEDGAIAADDESAICPPIGIVTERDIVQFKALELDLHQVVAKSVMSTPLFLLDPQDSLWAAHEAMREHKVRRLVVSWNWGKGIGIITQTSLLRVFDPIEMCGIIDSLQQTVRQLQAESTEKTPEAQPAVALEKEASIQSLLERAVACIDQVSQHTHVTPAQQQSLQKATQLIQQVHDSPVGLADDEPADSASSATAQLDTTHPTVKLKLL